MRQFLLDTELAPSQKMSVTGKDFKYLAQVLRLGEGSSFEGRLPSGKLCTLVVVARSKNEMILQRTDNNAAKTDVPPDFSGSTVEGGMSASLVAQNKAACILSDGTCCGYGVPIWLLQCMPKASKLDDIVRQCTEIGVEKIFLVASDRSVANAGTGGGSKTERWNRIIKEARQQSASPVGTTLYAPAEMKDALANLKECLERRRAKNGTADGREQALLVMTEAPLHKKGLHEFVRAKPSTVVLAVGSEGGISPEELEMLAEFGFEPLHFSTNVLRSETAAIYGVSAVQSIMTEFELWQCKE